MTRICSWQRRQFFFIIIIFLPPFSFPVRRWKVSPRPVPGCAARRIPPTFQQLAADRNTRTRRRAPPARPAGSPDNRRLPRPSPTPHPPPPRTPQPRQAERSEPGKAVPGTHPLRGAPRRGLLRTAERGAEGSGGRPNWGREKESTERGRRGG